MPRPWNTYVLSTMERISPLYTHLTRQIENDPELLGLENLVEKHQPRPITFFASVQSLLIRERHHPLARYYPYLSPSLAPAHEAYPAFRDFCLTYRDELQCLLPQARLQTNEVSRCGHLLPAFELVFRRGGKLPLALIELGTSAGLNLFWDQYGYRYTYQDGSEVTAGQVGSPVQICCPVESHSPLPLPEVMPPVTQRVGIDLSPLDIFNEGDIRRLLGAIWPEESSRYSLLEAAITLVRQSPPQLFPGDASVVLPDILASLPEGNTVCLWHSYALRQGPPAVRERVEEIIADHSRYRTLYRISLEIEQGQWEAPRLELFTYRGGRVQHEWLATCEVHGDHMNWHQSLAARA